MKEITPSLPVAFLERMKETLVEDFHAFAESIAQPAPVSLRQNPSKPLASFAGSEEVPWCPGGIYLPERPGFYRDPRIFGGSFYVQEASSMIIHQALNLPQGARVLDLCASPGGKSTLLAAAIGKEGMLVSNELVGARLQALEENLVRWGLSNGVVTSNRADDFGRLRHFFDLILVDAPCSGEGMFRKDPDTITHWSPGNLQICEARQEEILAAVIPALKPGGRLIYSTCTFNPKENEERVRWLLDSDPGLFRMVEIELPQEWGWIRGDVKQYGEEMKWTWRALPHRVKGEGFFLSVLEKCREGAGGEFHQSAKSIRKFGKPQPEVESKQKNHSKPKKGEPEPDYRFYLSSPDSFVIRQEGELVNAVPAFMEEDVWKLQSQVRVRKAGLLMGESKHGKFVPSHDLALCSDLSPNVQSFEVDLNDGLRFLKKMEMKSVPKLEKGWAVVRFEGLALGWVRVLDNRLNNHLPGYLRIQKYIEGIG